MSTKASKMRKAAFILAIACLLLTMACGRQYSKKEKEAIAADMMAHLVQKYEGDFELRITGNVHYTSFEITGGGVGGLKAEANPVNDPDTVFTVEYWEKSNEIEDDYMKLVMGEKLGELVESKGTGLLGDELTVGAWFDIGPFNMLPSNEFTMESTLPEFNRYAALVDIFVLYDGSLDKETEALHVEELQNRLIESGLQNFMVSVFYMDDTEYAKLDETLEKIKASVNELDEYSYCRSQPSCWVTSVRVEKGIIENSLEDIRADFDFARKTVTEVKSGETWTFRHVGTKEKQKDAQSVELTSVSSDTGERFTYTIHKADGSTETRTDADFAEPRPYPSLLPGESVEFTNTGDKAIVTTVDANLIAVERKAD